MDDVFLGDRRIGVAEYSVTTDGRTATIERVELEAAYRGWGYGTEVVRLLEDGLARKGVREFSASVDLCDGLGLYFWLRLGYRPAGISANGPRQLQMVRSLLKA